MADPPKNFLTPADVEQLRRKAIVFPMQSRCDPGTRTSPPPQIFALREGVLEKLSRSMERHLFKKSSGIYEATNVDS